MAAGLVCSAMFLPALVPGAIVGCAIAPALLLLWLVVAADSRPEPPRVVWLCVGLGALSVLPVGLLEFWLQRHVPVGGNAWLAAYQSAMLFAGLPEETVKISIIAAVALRARDFDEPMDGVVYGAAVGLGFAAVENLGYVASAAHWATVAVMRGLLSVPFHGALGAVAGGYIARARFGGALGAHSGGRWRRPRLILSAWLIPVVLHALFDGPVTLKATAADDDTANSAGILAMVAIMLVVGFGTIVFAVRLARRIAHHQKPWLQTRRLPPAHWRGVWARSLIGVGLSLVAGALVIAGNLEAHIAGWTLMAVGVGISWKCRRYLSEAAARRHHLAAGPAS